MNAPSGNGVLDFQSLVLKSFPYNSGTEKLEAPGGSGGTSYDNFLTREAIATTAIPLAITRIITVGYSEAGDDGAGAPYVRGDDTGDNAIVDALGQTWVLDLRAAKTVVANWFGMVPDGHDSWDGTTLTRTGTDNAPMLQAAIDCAIRNKIRVVTILDGTYATDDTIHLGYGNNLSVFVDIELLSASGGRGAYAELSGVRLLPKRIDRPTINFQGVRMGRISGICIMGFNYYWLANTTLPRGVNNNLPETWFYSALVPVGDAPGGLSRYAPYAAITIDAYKGAANANKYPDVNYPAWSGANTQYNKSASSDITIDNNYLAGFATCICTPSGDGNADFIKIRDNAMNYSVHAIAICNTQSRNVDIDSNNFERCHTIVNNNAFGVNQGRFGGPISNSTIGNSYQIFDFRSLGYLGQTSFNHIYTENVVRLGYVNGSLSLPAGFVFTNCHFDHDPQGGSHTLPNALIEGIGNVNFDFTNCFIYGARRIYNLMTVFLGTVSINGGNIVGGTYWTGARGSIAMQRAVNYCCGMFIGGGFFGNPYNVGYPRLKVNTSFLGEMIDDFFSEGSQSVSTYCDFIGAYGSYTKIHLNQFNEGINGSYGNRFYFRTGGPNAVLLFTNPAHVNTLVNVGDVWTFNVHNDIQSDPSRALVLGSIIYNQNSGTIMVVTEIGALSASYWPITAIQQNNMKIDGTGAFESQLLADLTWSGNSFSINTSVMIPREVYYGDFTTGNPVVSNVTRGDTVGNELANYLSNTDILFRPLLNGSLDVVFPYANGTKILSVTNGNPGTITLDSGATATGRFKIYPLPLI